MAVTLVQDERRMYRFAESTGKDVFTAVFAPHGEEIDVVARDRREAILVARAAAERDYEPMELVHIIGPRVGWFF